MFEKENFIGFKFDGSKEGADRWADDGNIANYTKLGSYQASRRGSNEKFIKLLTELCLLVPRYYSYCYC